MLRKIWIIGLLALFLLWNITLPAYASGVYHAKVGEEVRIKEVSNNEWSLKWILKQAAEVIEMQTGRDFKYTFDEEGEYNVVLNLIDESSLLESKVKILVGDDYILPSVQTDVDTWNIDAVGEQPNLKAVLETLPLTQEDGNIYFQTDTGTVTFLASSSIGDIYEYRIDKNVYYDSDGDGDPANDIDNQNDISFLTGASFTTEYDKSWGKMAARLTVVNQDWKQDSVEVEVLFVETLPTFIPDNTTAKLEAKLLNLPRQDKEDQKIYLSGDEANVTFLSNLSKGEIVEYRIDKNIYYDSSGDGNPSNDIDNLSHPSFHTGENFETNYAKDWGKLAVQLTVVSNDGQGSLIQREIIFDDKKAVKEVVVPKEKIEVELWADKTEIFGKGEVNFEAKNGKTGETYKWDFDGDSKIDLETQETKAVYSYDTVGNYLVTLQVTNAEGDSIQKTQKVVIREVKKGDSEFATKVPLVGFEYMVQGPKVIFVNQTAVDPNLQNQDFRTLWDFGDGTTSTEKSTEHIFPEIADYNVTLEITDSVGNKNSKQDIIQIMTLEVPVDEVVDEDTQEVVEETGATIVTTPEETEPKEVEPSEEEVGKAGLLWGVVKIFLYLIIGVVVLALFGLAGYLVYLKIQHPDFTFGELIEEEKHKIFGGGSSAYDPEKEQKTETAAVVDSWNQGAKPKENVAAPQTKPAQQNATPVKPAEPASGASQPEAKAVPSWLQQAQQKAKPATSNAAQVWANQNTPQTWNAQIPAKPWVPQNTVKPQAVQSEAKPLVQAKPQVWQTAPQKTAQQPKAPVAPIKQPAKPQTSMPPQGWQVNVQKSNQQQKTPVEKPITNKEPVTTPQAVKTPNVSPAAKSPEASVKPWTDQKTTKQWVSPVKNPFVQSLEAARNKTKNEVSPQNKTVQPDQQNLPKKPISEVSNSTEPKKTPQQLPKKDVSQTSKPKTILSEPAAKQTIANQVQKKDSAQKPLVAEKQEKKKDIQNSVWKQTKEDEVDVKKQDVKNWTVGQKVSQNAEAKTQPSVQNGTMQKKVQQKEIKQVSVQQSPKIQKSQPKPVSQNQKVSSMNPNKENFQKKDSKIESLEIGEKEITLSKKIQGKDQQNIAKKSVADVDNAIEKKIPQQQKQQAPRKEEVKEKAIPEVKPVANESAPKQVIAKQVQKAEKPTQVKKEGNGEERKQKIEKPEAKEQVQNIAEKKEIPKTEAKMETVAESKEADNQPEKHISVKKEEKPSVEFKDIPLEDKSKKPENSVPGSSSGDDDMPDWLK